jgi:hypothetical protein
MLKVTILCLVVLFLPATNGSSHSRFYDLKSAEELFKGFVSRFRRKYSNTSEYGARFQIFQETIKRINARNEKTEEALHGITRFADKTAEEWERIIGSSSQPSFFTAPSDNNGTGSPYVPPPPGNCSKNWVENSFQYTVRNQLGCGNCWSYAVPETIRDNFYVRHGKDPGRLSSQFLTDCATTAWVCSGDAKVKNGCCGGDPFMAMNWIAKNGIATTEAYGGEKYDPSLLANVSESALDPDKLFKCKASVRRVVYTASPPQLITGVGYFNMTEERMDTLKRIRDKNGTIAAARYACTHFGIFCPVPGTRLLRSPEPYILNQVCNVGPIVIGVCGKDLGTYVSGVITADTCCNTLSHSVQLVGFDGEKQAYIVRNSWGGLGGDKSNFGVSPFPPYEPYHQLPDGNWTNGGYFLLKYGQNTCGAATRAIKTPELTLA